MQGEFEFRKEDSEKWNFDVEIGKLRAEVLFPC
jgi:hypothetical protein